MEISSKKLVIGIIIVGALFVLFLNFAFNSIQKVEMDVTFDEDAYVSDYLMDIAETIASKADNHYVDDVSMNDIKMNLILVDHVNKSACFVEGEAISRLDYEELDRRYINCNSYLMTTGVNNRATIIVNCDEILGDAVARAISSMYHYGYCTTSVLSPERVEYFANKEQDMIVSYYRYQMIESAKSAYFDGEKLDVLYENYRLYSESLAENTAREAVNYDYYDGLKEYVYVQVMMEDDEGFDLESYINSFVNEQGIYTKDDEYKAMGLLLCLLLKEKGISITENVDKKGEWYKLLLVMCLLVMWRTMAAMMSIG